MFVLLRHSVKEYIERVSQLADSYADAASAEVVALDDELRYQMQEARVVDNATNYVDSVNEITQQYFDKGEFDETLTPPAPKSLHLTMSCDTSLLRKSLCIFLSVGGLPF